MIEICGAIIGFLGSTLPNCFRYIQDRSDKKHELEVMQMQIDRQRDIGTMRLEEIGARTEIAESKAIYKTFYSGIKFIDGLNGSVRPILAYGFFLLYAGIKAHLSYSGVSVDLLWTNTDNAIFLTIISFFYGQRAMQKVFRG